ncbi:MAG TPA: hypothetical protein VIA82_11595 [Candidatus Limnocylindria bacterium]|jgi:hypothetical protein
MQRIRLAILAIVLAACQQGGGGGGAGEPTVAPSNNLAEIQALTDCTKLQETLDAATQAARDAATAQAATAAQAQATAARKRMEELSC